MRKWVTVLAALAIVGVSSAQAAEKLKVAIPQKGFWDSSWVEFGEAAGFFKEAGL
jgi:NitT/TauT family transport system substrate-binding protein